MSKRPKQADSQQRLVAHRELQYLRAAAWKPKKGQGRRKVEWMHERARKLDQAKGK